MIGRDAIQAAGFLRIPVKLLLFQLQQPKRRALIRSCQSQRLAAQRLYYQRQIFALGCGAVLRVLIMRRCARELDV